MNKDEDKKGTSRADKLLNALTDIPASFLWAISKTIKFLPAVIVAAIIVVVAMFFTDKELFRQVWAYLIALFK